MIVQFKSKDSHYTDLSEGQGYFVIGVEAGDYRILNDFGKPYLYPYDLFVIVDPHAPEDWITDIGDDGEQYSYPPQLNQAGFFEDFFEHKPEQISIFWHVVNQRLTNAA
jgi:hypothetical protein